MYDLFTHKNIEVAGCRIDLVMAGKGPGLLLLHGFPETKMAWHKIASQLTTHHTVVIPDLPGYGDSTGPVPDKDHENYSKRSFGNIMASLMQQLGFDRYAVAGHDRGGRVAYRMTLDHPEQITQLAVLNIVPAFEMMKALNYAIAMEMHNWLFLAQPAPLPETMIQASSPFYLDHVLNGWSKNPASITQESRNEYLRCFQKPEVIAAICEEYRATPIDVAHDKNDHIHHHQISCPVLALWSDGDLPNLIGDPLKIWGNWAAHISGKALKGGHFLMEECPDEVMNAFMDFFMR